MAEEKTKKHGSVRGYMLKRRYGLTEKDVDGFRSEQGGLCLICLRPHSLHVDHDHATGDYRGLLCFRCNGGLGQFQDDPRVMRRAVDYLERRIGPPWRARAARPRRGVAKSRKGSRHYRLTQRYGIGPEDVRRMIESQGGRCPVCEAAPAGHVDHDHVTGEVRGILCADCNTGMEQLRDSPWVLRRVIEYLTGGLSRLGRDDVGARTIVRTEARPGVERVRAGWELARECGDDAPLLYALTHEDSGDPYEGDVDPADPPQGPVLDTPHPGSADIDLSRLEPLGPPEYAFA